MTAAGVTCSVLMITYNHEPYIAAALESVLAQETHFPVEIVIGTDRSTDRTDEIVGEYAARHPARVRVIRRPRNVGASTNFVETYLACRGRYVAVLEGDDYWTDPRKLQTQVDYLDAHPECVTCGHRVLARTGDALTPPAEYYRADGRQRPGVPEVAAGRFPPTCSTVWRRVLTAFPAWSTAGAVMDWPAHLLHALRGDLVTLPEPMAIYRRHPGGVWSPLSEAAKMATNLRTIEQLDRGTGYRHRAHFDRVRVTTLLDMIRLARSQGDTAGGRALIPRAVAAMARGRWDVAQTARALAWLIVPPRAAWVTPRGPLGVR